MACAETWEEKITCSICSDRFTKPKALPCLHTFCRHCLDSYIQNQAAEHVDISTFPCPVCRRESSPTVSSAPVSEWADQFPTNHHAASLMESVSSKQKIGWSNTDQHISTMADIDVQADQFTTILDLQDTSRSNRALRQEPISVQSINVFTILGKCKDAAFFPDGTLMLVENDGGNVCGYNTSYKRVLDVSRSPSVSCACVISVERFVVTMKQSPSISMFDKNCKEVGSFSLSSNCHGIANIADKGMLVTCEGEPGSIRVLQNNGEPVCMFSTQQGKTLFGTELYIATNNGASCIVVTDSQQDCVHCYSSEGKLRWEKSIPGASGVVLLGSYILVAAKAVDKVMVLDTEGNIVNTVLDIKDGIQKPRVLAVSKDLRRLLVIGEDSDIARIFRLMKPSSASDVLF